MSVARLLRIARMPAVMLAGVLSLAASAAFANDRIAVHGDWSVFAAERQGKQVCWTATRADPDVASGGLDSNTFGRMLILYTIGSNEFSVTADGGSFGTNEGWIVVDGDSHALFFQNNWAWLKNRAHESKVHAAFATCASMRSSTSSSTAA